MNFDVVVVGAGHAGCEAAAAAARLGRAVALVTLRLDAVGRLSCNPAIGGLAKGHLVREVDALGGLMGRVADASCIQFRRLNTRKGLAVQSSRAQVDIDHYPRVMARELASLPNLTLLEGEAAEVLTASGRVAGLRLADGRQLHAPAVVLTTGTFLRAVMHCGSDQTEGGRLGDVAAHQLAASLAHLGLRLGRLKTGTVPRLDARTIRWDALEEQEDLMPEGRFSFRDVPRELPQVRCHRAYTTEQTHHIVREAFARSPLFSGQITGTGPRYCPSIEDKVARFPDRDRHLLYLEPEGHQTHRVYVNGLSTSLPVDVQLAMVRSVPGLEDAEVLQWGYAVEYDFADPRDLDAGLQHRSLPGLYLAGQVNGTSGYEEAAGQGLVAGASAATGEALRIGRDEGYLGVMVDDLTTKGVGGEPYRMFTSRAEHRLLLREDNADLRLMPKGRSLGLVADADWAAFEARQLALQRGRDALNQPVHPNAELVAAFEELGWVAPRKPATVEALLRRPEVSWSALRTLIPGLPDLSADTAEQLIVDVRYAGYVDRAARRVASTQRMDALRLPEGVDWMQVSELSYEVRERLTASLPETLGQAARLPGVPPAAVQALAAWVVRQRSAQA